MFTMFVGFDACLGYVGQGAVNRKFSILKVGRIKDKGHRIFFQGKYWYPCFSIITNI